MRKMQPSTIIPMWTCLKVYDLPDGLLQTEEIDHTSCEEPQVNHNGCVPETKFSKTALAKRGVLITDVSVLPIRACVAS
jgi:hypothetical protein